ncbi:hypothetical protein P5673_017979 [Acropora cervicornis]|uniref:Uncharacterized protein n=1 Tax=Acropora cervicornis TaxID=6130 RepID=A0AAD9QED4_ACRCE|nr:hypothetical protein P5673_017979 [Acropora cervicornis]
MVAERLHPQPKHRLQSFAFSETNDATAAVNCPPDRNRKQEERFGRHKKANWLKEKACHY